MCTVLGVSASGYFEHRRCKPQQAKPGTRLCEAALLTHIRIIHAQVKAEYGWPKVYKELLARGLHVGKERVRKLIQRHGIRARCKRKYVITTDSKHKLPIADNLLALNFHAEQPN
jgi:putative transposase